MNYIVDCKNIETAIKRAKNKLISEAKKNRIYENFGQKEARLIADKFIDVTDYSEEMHRRRALYLTFYNWSANFEEGM